jgi:hypothetical protein
VARTSRCGLAHVKGGLWIDAGDAGDAGVVGTLPNSHAQRGNSLGVLIRCEASMLG